MVTKETGMINNKWELRIDKPEYDHMTMEFNNLYSAYNYLVNWADTYGPHATFVLTSIPTDTETTENEVNEK